MYICTCNNCGNIYEDVNYSSSVSIDYLAYLGDLFNVGALADVFEDGDLIYGCPICLTDRYLVFNINIEAGGRAAEIGNSPIITKQLNIFPHI